MKNIVKSKPFLSGTFFVTLISIFYFYQYFTVFQLSDNPSENKKYVQFSNNLNELLADSDVVNFEKRIIQGDFSKLNKKLTTLNEEIAQIDLSGLEDTKVIIQKLDEVTKENDLIEHLNVMKKEKKELLKKSVSFLKLSEKNNWPTVIKISNTIVEKISKLDLNSKINDLNSEQDNISKDVNYILRITNVSSIDAKSKTIIKERVDSIIESLDNYKNSLAPLSLMIDQTNNLIKLLSEWNKQIESKAAGNLIVIENKEREIQNAKWTYVIFALTCILIIYLVSYVTIKNLKKTHAEIALSTIKDGLFSNSAKSFIDEFGIDVDEQIQKYRQYMAKRISFGSVFQETIPFAAAIFKNDKRLQWQNSEFKKLELAVENLESLFASLDIGLSVLEEEKPIFETQIDINGYSYNMFLRKSKVGDENYYVLYTIPDKLEKQKQINQKYDELLKIVEEEGLISTTDDFDISNPRKLIGAIKNNLTNKNHENFFQTQLDDLENQVFDYHKINMDISNCCSDLNSVREEILERNNKISKNLLKIITSKENTEKLNSDFYRRIKFLKDFNEKLLEAIETVVKEIFILKDHANKNELSYGQLKQEIENIYIFMANIGIPDDLDEEINLETNDEFNSSESELIVADLLNEHYKSMENLVNKLNNINEMLIITKNNEDKSVLNETTL